MHVAVLASLLPMARLRVACPPLLGLAWPPEPWPALVVVARCHLGPSMDLQSCIVLVFVGAQV